MSPMLQLHKKINPVMKIEKLMQLPLFGGCSPDKLQQLLEEAPNRIQHYSPGDFMARQGDVCRSLYLLLEGTVMAQMENEEGKQLTIDWLEAPEILAPAFIYASDNRFPVSAQATAECEVLIMDSRRFSDFMHEQSAVMKNFIRMISDRSLFLSRKLNEFALQSLKSRLMNYLSIHGKIDNQQKVAFILGVARPSLARALSELAGEGRISISGKRIILNESASD